MKHATARLSTVNPFIHRRGLGTDSPITLVTLNVKTGPQAMVGRSLDLVLTDEEHVDLGIALLGALTPEQIATKLPKLRQYIAIAERLDSK